MSHVGDILIATTRSDVSLRYFLKENVQLVYFESDTKELKRTISNGPPSIVYIRDPFNTGLMGLDDIVSKIDLIRSNLPEAYYVDGVCDKEGVLFEDKWRQYQIWSKWMPATTIGGSKQSIIGPTIAKKRISARARDILFDVPSEEVTSDWIIQEQLEIIEELRAYLLLGQPVTVAVKRRPKGPRQSIKATGLRDLAEDEIAFIHEIAAHLTGYDLVGLDIARTKEGLRLIEVNRSPQFERYNELCGANLVGDFWPGILKRLS